MPIIAGLSAKKMYQFVANENPATTCDNNAAEMTNFCDV